MSETPSWGEVFRARIQKALLELHSAMPGQVTSYNAARQTATVKPLIKWQSFVPGVALKRVFDIPPLPDVLVCHPGAGDQGVHLPIAAGDLVLLVFCDRSLTTWRASSNPGTPADPDTYEPLPLAGAVALPLMTHDTRAWSGGLVAGSSVNIGKSGGSFQAVALAQKALDEMNKIRQVLNSHIHTTTATIGVGPALGVISPPTTQVGTLVAPAAQDVKAS